MKWMLAPALLLTAACSGEPAAKDAEKATKAADSNDSDVKDRKKSIEEAADEAAKLVEAEAKEEIDALEPTQ
jgi:hypothetical protein